MGCFATSDTKHKEKGIYGYNRPEESQEAINFALNKGEEAGLASQLEVHISCTNLKNVDVGSLTDSACVLYVKDSK